MSASVRIESGIAAGTNYWIDRPVLRMGSDPQCEISLPSAELSPHALTLEFRGGVYRAYNRSSSRSHWARRTFNLARRRRGPMVTRSRSRATCDWCWRSKAIQDPARDPNRGLRMDSRTIE